MAASIPPGAPEPETASRLLGSAEVLLDVKRLRPMIHALNPTLGVALLQDISGLIRRAVPEVGGSTTGAAPVFTKKKTSMHISSGVLHLYLPAGGLSLNENCDPTVRTDMLEGMRRIGARVLKNAEGLAARPGGRTEGQDEAALAAARKVGGPNPVVLDYLVRKSVAIPIQNNQPVLGTWQGVYAFFDSYEVYENDRNPGKLKLLVSVLGPGAEFDRVRYDTLAKRSLDIRIGSAAATSALHGGVFLGSQLSTALAQLGPPRLVPRYGFVRCFQTHHTSASLAVVGRTPESVQPQTTSNTIADSDAPALEDLLDDIVPDSWNDDFFEHTHEGRDDMSGHLKSTLLGCHASVDSGCSAEKAVCLNEHRVSRNSRMVSSVTLLVDWSRWAEEIEVPLLAAGELGGRCLPAQPGQGVEQIKELVGYAKKHAADVAIDVTEPLRRVVERRFGMNAVEGEKSSEMWRANTLGARETGLVYVSATRADGRVAVLQELTADLLRVFSWKPLLLSSAMVPVTVLFEGPERVYCRANPGLGRVVKLSVVVFAK